MATTRPANFVAPLTWDCYTTKSTFGKVILRHQFSHQEAVSWKKGRTHAAARNPERFVNPTAHSSNQADCVDQLDDNQQRVDRRAIVIAETVVRTNPRSKPPGIHRRVQVHNKDNDHRQQHQHQETRR